MSNMNTNFTILASAARTATVNSADFPNKNWKGGVFVVDVTAASLTPSVVFTVQGKDPLSGQYYTIVASAAVTGISTNLYRVYPGLTAVANLTVSDVLPSLFRLNCVHADTDSITYSIGFLGVV